MAGCRDCSRCTEVGCLALLLALPRALLFICGGFLFGMAIKKCPQCSHRMSLHAKRADGSFKD